MVLFFAGPLSMPRRVYRLIEMAALLQTFAAIY
jgi:hypothetical protein